MTARRLTRKAPLPQDTPIPQDFRQVFFDTLCRKCLCLSPALTKLPKNDLHTGGVGLCRRLLLVDFSKRGLPPKRQLTRLSNAVTHATISAYSCRTQPRVKSLPCRPNRTRPMERVSAGPSAAQSAPYCWRSPPSERRSRFPDWASLSPDRLRRPSPELGPEAPPVG